ncbi:MAG: general secretion pathway protein GspB [bacterium]
MSYILDALKKSQAEQNPDGVRLAANSSGAKKTRPKGLLTLVIILVATNIGLLLWVTLQKPRNNITASGTPAITPQQAAPTSLPALPDDTAEPQAINPTITPTGNPAAANGSVSPASESAAPSLPSRSITQPGSATTSTRPVRQVKLAELPLREQARFNSFNYSSHIYTDDPDLCAVVINGQRLSAGDVFEGMEVIAITEDGVIFNSTRTSPQGQTEQLHVAVSVIEQWEN